MYNIYHLMYDKYTWPELCSDYIHALYLWAHAFKLPDVIQTYKPNNPTNLGTNTYCFLRAPSVCHISYDGFLYPTYFLC